MLNVKKKRWNRRSAISSLIDGVWICPGVQNDRSEPYFAPEKVPTLKGHFSLIFAQVEPFMIKLNIST